MRSTNVVQAQFEQICEEQYLPMSDGTQLKILTSKLQQTIPENSYSTQYTLMLIPGWGTIVPSWDDFLMEAAQRFNIVYLETREKDSSILGKHTHSNMDRNAQDIQEVIEFLNVSQKQLILVGSCFGANSIAYGLMRNRFSPLMNVFIGPQLRFPLPWYGRFLIPIAPYWMFYFFRPILRFWLRYFQTTDKKQAQKYIRIINEADPKKWKKVGKAVYFEEFSSIFPQINQFIYVIGEGNDKMHKASDSLRIAQMLPKSEFVMMESNAETHSAMMAKTIAGLISQLQITEKRQ
ncbi:MAG: hypothetical protein ACTSWC_12505 [Promethearchaeota archaeon]